LQEEICVGPSRQTAISNHISLKDTGWSIFIYKEFTGFSCSITFHTAT